MRSIHVPVVSLGCVESLTPFLGDFAPPEFYDLLECAGFYYAIGLQGNPVPARHIDHLLTRPMGRRNGRPDVRYHGFEYQAANWDKPRRVVAN